MLLAGGIDPSGGAGLSVDGAAVRALGLHPAPVCALVTLQDGTRYVDARPVSARLVTGALQMVAERLAVKALKTGALGSAANVRAVVRFARQHRHIALVVDPVVRSTTAGALFDASAVALLQRTLFPLATLVTPNLDEAELLTGLPCRTPDQMHRAAQALLAYGPRAVLLKGGHLDGPQLVDVLALDDGTVRRFTASRLDVPEVRGTGCALASLCAGHIALGASIEDAVQAAAGVLRDAMSRASRVGDGPRVLSF